MQQQQGVRSPEKREGRARLSVRDPQIEKLLAGLALEGDDLEPIRQFGKALWQWRNEYDIRRRRGGMFSPGRLTKADADRRLKAALAAMAEGGGL